MTLIDVSTTEARTDQKIPVICVVSVNGYFFALALNLIGPQKREVVGLSSRPGK